MIKEIKDSPTWNKFLIAQQPNTFLQSWQWGQVQVATGEQVKYLGLFDNDNQQIGAALVIVVNARRGRHYLIPHGPVFKDVTPARNAALIKNILSYLRSTAPQDRVIALRIAPLMENTAANRDLFKNLGFHPAPLHVHAELTWVLDISQHEAELLAGMRKTTRYAIRKAQHANVTTQIITSPNAILSRFWPLYQQTQTRHGFTPWPKKMIKAQLKYFNDHIFAVIAIHDSKDVAAGIIPTFGQTAFYYHGASRKLPSAISATQLLQWTALREAQRRGLKRYNFWGIAPENEPKHPFAGISTFKKGFGGYAIDYLHAQDLPLSVRYFKLWAIDTYRKYRRGF